MLRFKSRYSTIAACKPIIRNSELPKQIWCSQPPNPALALAAPGGDDLKIDRSFRWLSWRLADTAAGSKIEQRQFES